MAEGIASAVLLGSWAGDVRRLSARACVGELWEAEGRLVAAARQRAAWWRRGVGRGVVGEAVRGKAPAAGEEERRLLEGVREGGAGEVERGLGVEGWCVYGLKGGLGVLVGALEGWVRGVGGVEVVVGAGVREMRMVADGCAAVKVGNAPFVRSIRLTVCGRLLVRLVMMSSYLPMSLLVRP